MTTAVQTSGSDLLNSMLAGAENASKNMQTEVSFNLGTLLGDVQNQMSEGEAARTDSRVSNRRQIMEANFQTARKDIEQKALDLHELITNLDVFVKTFGLEISQLDQPDPSQVARLATAKSMLAIAEAALAKAKTRLFFKNHYSVKASAELERAKLILDQTGKDIATEIRTRLMGSSIESTLSTFQKLTGKVIERLGSRINEIQTDLTIVSNQLRVSLQTKEAASQKLTEFAKQKEALEAAITHESDVLSGIENGTAEYAKQDQILTELKTKLQTCEGNISIVTALFQDTEVFCVRLAEHEKVQQKLLSNHKTWSTLLQSQTAHRVKTWRSTLGVMKAADDQEIAQTLVTTGRSIDKQTDDIVAKAYVASERALMETKEAYAQHLKDLVEIAGATVEVQKEIHTRNEQLAQAAANHYGIDMSQLNQFSGLGEKAA